jgi:hypothetical protein
MTLADYRHFILAIEKKIICPTASQSEAVGKGDEDKDDNGLQDSA